MIFPGVRLASTLWSTVNGIARKSIQLGIIKVSHLDSKVISVGNIQAGGAGKTPIVATIGREAEGFGLSCCILLRGYKSSWEKTGGVILPFSESADPAVCGDEAALIQQLCPSAYIGVGADRKSQYENVLQKAGKKIDLVILDDGLQNWKIHKDCEIIALTSHTPDEVLFRDFPDTVKSADILVWTKGSARPAAFGKPLVRVKYEITPPKGKRKYVLITGVADPRDVSQLAKDSGYQIVREIFFKDHFSYNRNLLEKLIQEAESKEEFLLTTGKDWVKWKFLDISTSRIEVIEPHIRFVEGKEHWQKILWEK